MVTADRHELKHHGIRLAMFSMLLLAFALSSISLFALDIVSKSKDVAIFNFTPRLLASEKLMILSEELESSGRAYLFTKREELRSSYRERMRTVDKTFLDQLNDVRTLSGLPTAVQFTDQINQATQDYLREMNLLGLKQRAGAAFSNIEKEYDSLAQPLVAQLKKPILELARFNEDHLKKASVECSLAASLAMKMVILGGLIAIALGTFFVIWENRILRRIRETEKNLLDAVQVRDEFLSVASHELKNPLTALTLQFQLLRRKLDSNDSSKSIHGELAESCEKSIKGLSTLVNELLDLTRLRLGRLSLDKSSVDLSGVVQDVVEANLLHATQSGSIITIDSLDPIVGNWDLTRIHQIMTNLVSNAIKYGEGKPIHIRVESDQARGLARIIVKDEGMGVPPEMREKIFLRFERGTSPSKIKGLGLGLYIVRQITEAHGGRIWVDSNPGKGSTFTVELPF